MVRAGSHGKWKELEGRKWHGEWAEAPLRPLHSQVLSRSSKAHFQGRKLKWIRWFPQWAKQTWLSVPGSGPSSAPLAHSIETHGVPPLPHWGLYLQGGWVHRSARKQAGRHWALPAASSSRTGTET